MESPEQHDTGLRPDQLDPNRPAPLETPWGSFALFVVDGRVLAVQSFCPHLEGPLFQGTRSGTTITCPWHQWCFSLETGERLDLAGRLGGGRPRLATAAVTLSERGTLVLARPAARP